MARLFLDYDWPGNLREMKNTIKRSVLLTRTGLITTEVLPHEMLAAPAPDESVALYKEDEEQAIRNALGKTNFNKSKAAKLLNIDRKTLYNKKKQYQEFNNQ